MILRKHGKVITTILSEDAVYSWHGADPGIFKGEGGALLLNLFERRPLGTGDLHQKN